MITYNLRKLASVSGCTSKQEFLCSMCGNTEKLCLEVNYEESNLEIYSGRYFLVYEYNINFQKKMYVLKKCMTK